MRVLVTRPEPGLSETMRDVAALGWEPVAFPMLSVSVRALGVVPPVAAVLVTSGQAVAAVADRMGRDVPVLAVGDRTAGRVRAAGFVRVLSAGGDAAALVALAREVLPVGASVLLACGAGQGEALAADLRRAGYRVVRRVVYRATPVRAQVPECGVVLLYSAMTARAFEAVRDRVLGRAVVLSGAVAAVLEGEGWGRIEVAGHPDQKSLLARLGRPG